ncbi:MAG: cobalamin-binding protein [Acidiferrobacterales bacterium]|nr:cobalamin-binding protein [Acidiferrobacterales bacterium]
MLRNLPRTLMAMAWLGLWFIHSQQVFAEGAVSVIDDTGATVSLAQAAQRIISLSPHATELLFAVGAGTQIVGAVGYSDYPAAAKTLPRIGSANRLDAEKIILLKPDLIVAWHSGNTLQDMKTLSRFNIPVFYSEPRKLDDIATNMDRLGRLTGHTKQASAKAKGFKKRLREIDGENENKSRVSIFFQLWRQPLMTVNGEHIISDVMTRCNARNVFEELPGLTPTVSREAVIERKPEVIVATDVALDELKKDWGSYNQIPAVRSGNYFVLSADLLHRQGPRLIRGVEQFCQAINSARVPDR